MKNIIVFSLILALFITSNPAPAAAQVSINGYTPQTQSELIAFLLGIISQQQNGQQFIFSTNANNQLAPSGQVRGVSTSNSTSRTRSTEVDVGTGFVSFDNGDIILNGTVDLEGSSFADVWFEYGEDDRFGEETRVRRVTSDRRFSAVVDEDEVDDLESVNMYYRAVGRSDSGRISVGNTRAIFIGNASRSRSNNDDEPDVDTESAREIDDDSAELRGEVDMNDFRNGLVFFVYGEDEDEVEDVEREDEYRDIRERGDDLQKFIVDSDLDRRDDYDRTINGLDDDTEYFFRICVEYEDEDDDETIECGRVEDFETDRD